MLLAANVDRWLWWDWIGRNTDLIESSEYELGIHLVGAREMARLNQNYLHHEGSTDVISFDYADGPSRATLKGEIFVSLDHAVAQAKRFRTTWQSELVRYLVHGVLHLRGHDDRQPNARRKMKRMEDRLLRKLSRRFPLSKPTRAPRVRP